MVWVAEKSIDCRFSVCGNEGQSRRRFQLKRNWPTFGEEVDDLPHLVLESDLENPVGFVNDERAKVVEDETFRVLLRVFSGQHSTKRTHCRVDSPGGDRGVVQALRSAS